MIKINLRHTINGRTLTINCDEIISLEPVIVRVGTKVVRNEILNQYYVESLEQDKNAIRKEKKKWQK